MSRESLRAITPSKDLTFDDKPRNKKKQKASEKDDLINADGDSWDFSRISAELDQDGLFVTLTFHDPEITMFVYAKTIESLAKSFPDMPPLIECGEASVVEGKTVIRVSYLVYITLKVYAYSQYITPRNIKRNEEVGCLTDMPQFPHLVTFFTNSRYHNAPFVMDCFVRIVRRWMASCTDDIHYPEQPLDFGATTLYERRLIYSKLLIILNTMLRLLGVHGTDFAEFVDPNTVGGTLIYNFLFLTEMDMLHKLFIQELRKFMDRFEDKRSLMTDHLNFFVSLELADRLDYTEDDGYADMKTPENWIYIQDFFAFKVHFFDFITDPRVTTYPDFCVMMMGLVTSSKISKVKNLKVLNFSRFLISKIPRVNAPFTKKRTISYTSGIPEKDTEFTKRKTINYAIYAENVKGSKEDLGKSKTTVSYLLALKLFLASLENRLHRTQIDLNYLPLEIICRKDPNVLFPFSSGKNDGDGFCTYLDEVFFYKK